MTSKRQDPSAPEPNELQSLAERLRAMDEALATPVEGVDDDILPVWDALPAAPTAEPTPEEVEALPALPAEEEPPAEVEEAPPPAVEEAPPPPPRRCPVCDAVRLDGYTYCNDCGYMFPADEPAAAPTNTPAKPAGGKVRLKDRYEIGEPLTERLGVARFRGLDHGAGSEGPVPVTVVRMAIPEAAKAAPAAEVIAEAVEVVPADEVLPELDVALPTALPDTGPHPALPAWPSPQWEELLLDSARSLALPAVLDSFQEGGFQYLVEELPTGRLLWDAWDDPDASAADRFGYLKQLAQALHALHQNGAMLEGIRPDVVVVTPAGQAKLADLSDLLPLSVPADAPVRARLYTAPELIVSPQEADARADLYSFGAMLYALHVGRELTEMDFERQGHPKPFIPRFPDIHPLFGRLMSKTFVHEVAGRFPTDEAAKEEKTGFTELIRVLETCRRTLDNVRLEVACWTTTGMVRTGNEDAFALVHAAESRQDDLGESALLLLCDGMGGYEAGEVAAAMALQALRKNLLAQPAFAALAGRSPFPAELPGHDPEPPRQPDPAEVKKLLASALKDANKQVYTASRSGKGRRGMGCTAEAVYVDGRHVVVGHVGDSRTYHLHEGRLIQLTRDQTLVNRLVELGHLTPEEAEDHPRRNELQQAIGGQPEVDPGLYAGDLKPGDWVIVCSDGVTNHVKNDELQQMLQLEATSAEMAARRLVNWVNINGATDNATIVVVRAT